MNNREAQNELCRSNKTPEEVYRIALSYEQGDKYANSYVATSAGGITGTHGSSGGGDPNPNRRYEKDDDTHPWELEDEEASQHASSIGWVKRNKPLVHMLDSSSLDGDYMVIALRHKRFTELKVAGAQLPIRTNGKAGRVWIDSGSPISIFTIGELRRNLRD